MRRVDKKKDITGNATKTINFEKVVLEKLEERAKRLGTSVSKLVNLMCRRIALSDEAFHQYMMKYHYMKFQEHKYLRENITENPVQQELKLLKTGKLTE